MVMGQASQHNYSAHMSTSLALGFLFMAGGGATFSTSPQATAALVIALFPRFPHSPTDHRCHLQVRLLQQHLYKGLGLGLMLSHQMMFAKCALITRAMCSLLCQSAGLSHEEVLQLMASSVPCSIPQWQLSVEGQLTLLCKF